MSDLGRRKLDHIRLCTADDPSAVKYPADRTTLLECIELLPPCFPIVSPEEVETETVFLGKRIAAPLLVSAMTGGPDHAGEINNALARACHVLRLPLALGSGRAMLAREDRAPTYHVRPLAPDIPIIANIGIAQAARLPAQRLSWLIERTEADALTVHLNFAMEAVQPEGDRAPSPVVETISRLRDELRVPIIVKEVGVGFSPGQLEALAGSGADWIDVAGAGGTSWVKIEGLRGGEREARLAATYSRWGIPTAAAVSWACSRGIGNVIASGGLSTGLDVAKAMALGARVGGMALPVLRAWSQGGDEGLVRLLEHVVAELKLAAHLCGLRSVSELAAVPMLVTEPLRSWIEAGK